MGLPHYAQGSRLIARGFFIMMNKMVVSNLVHRPIRSVISIVAIALEVTLILLIVGLCYGLMNDSKSRRVAKDAACESGEPDYLDHQ
jgi:hypothetical protein